MAARKAERGGYTAPVAAPAVKKDDGKKLSFKEQKEYEGLEAEIAKLEDRKLVIARKLNAGSGDYKELEAWAKEVEDLSGQVERMSNRWIELAERA